MFSNNDFVIFLIAFEGIFLKFNIYVEIPYMREPIPFYKLHVVLGRSNFWLVSLYRLNSCRQFNYWSLVVANSQLRIIKRYLTSRKNQLNLLFAINLSIFTWMLQILLTLLLRVTRTDLSSNRNLSKALTVNGTSNSLSFKRAFNNLPNNIQVDRLCICDYLVIDI